MIVVVNKPYGILSQFTTEPNSRWLSLASLNLPKNVYPVGRLDADSEGMLVLTDEPLIVSRLLEPKHRHPRTYWVQVEGAVTEDALSQLASGVTIQHHDTLPCKARSIDEPMLPERNPPIRTRIHIPTSWIEITLFEGKNRQVRRMTAAVGFPTLRLLRVQIGGLSLNALSIAQGEWCELSDRDRRLLQMSK